MYFLSVRNGEMYYNPLQKKMKLKKHRAPRTSRGVLVVSHRAFTSDELQKQDERMETLLAQGEQDRLAEERQEDDAAATQGEEGVVAEEEASEAD
jgi:hypothetical protein